MIKKYALAVLILIVWGSAAVFAQEDGLQLSLNRDIGAGFGTNIQGRFSMVVEGPDLVQVTFYIDDTPIHEQTSPPFRYQFDTGNYDTGSHTLWAAGVTADGRSLRSNQLQRTFITGSDSFSRIAYFIVPLLLLSIGGRLISTRIANRGQKSSEQVAVNGPYGGTICPKCHKPFARHWWAPNLVMGKYDRCPHCGKWHFATRMHPDLLQASLAASAEAEQENTAPPIEPQDDVKKRLDDSKFDG